jgi:hypothetical protein
MRAQRNKRSRGVVHKKFQRNGMKPSCQCLEIVVSEDGSQVSLFTASVRMASRYGLGHLQYRARISIQIKDLYVSIAKMLVLRKSKDEAWRVYDVIPWAGYRVRLNISRR